MKEIRSALIVGAGAIGAAIASRAYDVDRGSVALCASGARRERYARDGFVINGKHYDFPLADPAQDGPFGLVLVAVKNYDLLPAIREMRPFVGPDTTIVSLLNGVTSEETLRAEFGREKVPLAMIIGIDALRVGNRIDFPRPGEIRFGDEVNVPGSLSPRVEAISRFFAVHNVPYSVPQDMVRVLWYKFMFNVAINQWSAVLRAPYGVFQVNPTAQRLLADTMKEVIALANALKIGLKETDIDSVFDTIGGLGPEGRTSMLQDVDAERKTEVEAFAGIVVEKARQCGLKAPINQMLFDTIKTIEETYSLRSSPPYM